MSRLHKTFLIALLSISSMLSGCEAIASKSTTDANTLSKGIAEVRGTYTWNKELNQYIFSAKTELEEVISTVPPKQAEEILIECLDNTSSSSSTLDGKPVPLGVICYEGLSQLVYYEPTDASGDIDRDWQGVVSPKATTEELRSAKSAWKNAQQKRQLIFQ